MTLCADAFNVSDLAIYRPNVGARGPGGDETAPTLIYSDLPAVQEDSDVTGQDANGRTRQLVGKLFLDPDHPSTGERLQIKADDWATWTDYQGRTLRQQRISTVKASFISGDVDHLRLELT